MDGRNSDQASSLLGSPNPPLSRRNSASSLRNRFLSALPDKFRSDLHPEAPFDIDLSKTSELTQGEKDDYERQCATLKSFDEVDRIVLAESFEEDDENEKQIQAER